MTHELPATTLDDLLHQIACAMDAGDIAATTEPIVEMYARMRAAVEAVPLLARNGHMEPR